MLNISKAISLKRLTALALLATLFAAGQSAHVLAQDKPQQNEKGSYTLAEVTESSPAAGEALALEEVTSFRLAGGEAVLEPGTPNAETFTYVGVNTETNELTGVERPAPLAHPQGSWVEPVEKQPSPSPSPSPTDDPKPEPDPTHDGNGGGDKDHGSPQPGDRDDEGPDDPKPDDKRCNAKCEHGAKPDELEDVSIDLPSIASSFEGRFDTRDLVAAAAMLESLGMPHDKAVRKVFAPFIIGGQAAWLDTWGAPRFGPGPTVRSHQGQDVFCDYGDPVLAAEGGRVQFARQGLGGTIARLFRGNGTYFYYAHLDDWNRELENGDRVARGDVIGYCGNTGNARTTPPHVHFGLYEAGGKKAHNPMRLLVGWLERAELRIPKLLNRFKHRRLGRYDMLVASRRFGDGLLPTAGSQPKGDGAWLAGTGVETGILSLAEAALQTALERGPVSDASEEDDFEVVPGFSLRDLVD